MGLIIGILVVLLLGGAGAAYWLLLSPHRYVGTYELKTVTWMGRTVDMDELAKYMGAFMGLGGAGSTPPKVEVLLVLKGNGTGELQDKTPAGGGMFGGPKDTTVKWKAVKKGIEVAVSSGSGQSYTLTGKLTGKELALSAQQASSGMTLIKR